MYSACRDSMEFSKINHSPDRFIYISIMHFVDYFVHIDILRSGSKADVNAPSPFSLEPVGSKQRAE